MALEDREILNIITEELQQSAGGNENDFIDANRQAALATYLGQPDGKEQEGRSSVTSTDVADAIEWILPEIVKAFTQNNEVVTFDAVKHGDEDQADMESQYVYDVLMKDNNGFLIIHEFVKDALMQKNGFLKTYYEESVEVTNEAYTGLLQDELEMLLKKDDVDLIEMTEEDYNGTPCFDVKISRTKKSSKINVACVPPEEFRINKMHNSVDVSTARFTAHVLLKTSSDLIEEGYDKELVDSIPAAQVYEDDREYRFYMQDETVYPDRDINSDKSLRHIEISECYMHIDMDEDGIAEFVKVTVSGGDNPDVILDIEEIDENPFISATAILMSHKLFGLSIYDRLKEIQDQKTTLWRNILDNVYFQNNQRTMAVENQVNLDDLMLSRPGGIVRVKRPDALAPLITPPISGDAYKMMDYLDQVRSSRVGASPEGPITDSMIGDRVGSEGVERMMSQKEELVGLMVRVIAETGIKPLCQMIRRQVIKHQDVVKDYKFRGQWIPVDPSSWDDRPHTTVRVGTGSGNRKEQQGAIGQVMMIQDKLKAQPGQTLVTDNEIFTAVNDFAKFSGLSSAGSYLLDPKSPEGKKNKEAVGKQQQQAQQKDMEEKQKMLEVQTKIANAEESKAKTAGMNVQLKSQNEQMQLKLDTQKAMSDRESADLKQQLEDAKVLLAAEGKSEDLEFKYWDAAQRHAIERDRIESAEKTAAANKSNNDG